MEEDGCRETVIREIVEDKESEGEGEGEGRQSGRKGDRKYLVCLKEGMGGCEINRKTDKQRQTTNLFTLTH